VNDIGSGDARQHAFAAKKRVAAAAVRAAVHLATQRVTDPSPAGRGQG
jgi:hypothetical protein